ncbi:lysophospholipase L1-like esterase [Stackebrandtia albiflava]|uniref:Lysophospholipase L1-like esterase n=1 Tax=Stackebrandtia albiflava TaxID=406432 RepID=A0A562V9T1_9ACTN|nr:SGNH/GDSL hydrolase family protein [Stackebrandtia albiflava]TWJ14640.1 lysophospholipase L1-like esterase [Stackebrandtia albiflava]
MRIARRLAGLAVVVATASTAALAPVSPAQAQPGAHYVSLGDSFSSGSGAADYRDGDCLRSEHSFPVLLTELNELELSFAACGGADIHDVRNSQLPMLDPSTDRVTISVGGNDAGWADVIGHCVLAADDACAERIDTAEDYITGELHAALTGLYRDIRTRAPEAAVMAVGYPRLFAEAPCESAPGLTEQEQQWLNDAADLLNRVTLRAATEAGIRFADPRTAFTGHAVCDEDPWMHGLSNVPGDAFHPNPAGYAGYAEFIDWMW